MSNDICEGCGEFILKPLRLADGTSVPFCTWGCRQREAERVGWTLLQRSLPHVKRVVKESEKPPVYFEAEGGEQLICGACLLPTPVWGVRRVLVGRWVRFKEDPLDPESPWVVRLRLRGVEGCPECQYRMALTIGRTEEGRTAFLPEPDGDAPRVAKKKKVVWE